MSLPKKKLMKQLQERKESPKPHSPLPKGDSPIPKKDKKSMKQLQDMKDELQRENESLQKEVETLSEKNIVLKEKVEAIYDRLTSNIDIDELAISKKVKPADVPKEDLAAMISTLVLRTHQVDRTNPLESRLEDLETRVTHQTIELAKLMRLKYNSENSLEDILRSGSIEEAHKIANDLHADIKNTEIHVLVPDDIPTREEPNLDNKLSNEEENKLRLKKIMEPPSKKYKNIDLTPPKNKYPGDTHVRYMHKGLKQCVVMELSLFKGNAADWRMLAERLGFTDETIRSWMRMKLEHPMEQVFAAWEKSEAATLRMLHRHLVSPQMKYIVLAKRISDFYKVD